VLARYERAPAVFELEIEREGLEYHAGDCTLLVRDDHVDSRPYSFSSHPDEPVLRFLVRRMAGPVTAGSFSQWLDGLKPGDEVSVGTPFGWFRPGASGHEVWFATGTGISPFLSVLRGEHSSRPMDLFFGVRSPEDAILRPWLEERTPVHWAFSRVSEGRHGPHRVTDFVSEVSLGPEIQYFLCGNQRMIRSVAESLRLVGVPASHIHEELFFP